MLINLVDLCFNRIKCLFHGLFCLHLQNISLFKEYFTILGIILLWGITKPLKVTGPTPLAVTGLMILCSPFQLPYSIQIDN